MDNAFKENVTVHIIPSTHWDREWYITQRDFQFRLVRLMDKVLGLLERDDYPAFLLDGQCIMLEDYLEVRPENTDTVKRLVISGRLIIGPWYVVPDLFIPSGESTIKNLLIGRELCEKFGGGQAYAYTPDSFGLISQTPQIMKQFGMKAIQFTRGLRVFDEDERGCDTRSVVTRDYQNNLGCEFLWHSPDGSALPALYAGYQGGLFLSYPDIWRNIDLVEIDEDGLVKTALADIAVYDNFYKSGQRVWVVGCDHLEPRDTLPGVIKTLSEKIPGRTFIHSTPEAYCDNIKDSLALFPSIHGEQRGPQDRTFILGNVLSSRADIKRMNREAEISLQDYAEPLAVYSGSTGGSFDTKGFLALAWKLLLQNHPHDSIATSSIDEVHDDIETRLRQVRQIAGNVINCHFDEIGSSVKPVKYNDKQAVIIVYNASDRERTGTVEGVVRAPLKLPDCRYSLLDSDGRICSEAEISIMGRKRIDLETMKMSIDQLLLNETMTYSEDAEDSDVCTLVKVDFIARGVPANGYKCYTIVPCEADVASGGGAIAAPENSMENEFYKIIINDNGSIDVFNKSSDAWYRDLCVFEDGGDYGDEYSFVPVKGRGVYTTKALRPEVAMLESNVKRARFRITYEWPLPEKLDGLEARSPEHKTLKLTNHITLTSGSNRIEFKTYVENTVKDHRLRALFRFPFVVGYASSDTPFDLVARKVFDKPSVPEGTVLTKPMRNVLYIPGYGAGGDDMLILSRTSHEYEALSDGHGTEAALTLFRAVGSVIKINSERIFNSPLREQTRYWTADSQCLKGMEFEYALIISPDKISEYDALREGREYNLPFSVRSIEPGGAMPQDFSFLDISPLQAILSAVTRPGETGRGIVVRFYNAGNEPVDAKLRWRAPVKKAYETLLSGERVKELETDGQQTVFCPAGPWQIKTVELIV